MRDSTRRLLTAAAIAAVATAVWAGPTTAPETGPASRPATGPATAAAEPDPAALRILDELEKAGRTHTTIRADLDYKVLFGSLGDTQQRTGWVAYQAAMPAQAEAETGAQRPSRFRITFETLRQGNGATIRDLVDYAFDGQWLIEKKHSVKQIWRRQVAAPGQKLDAMRLGKGPFPVPFGQKADEVLQYFHVATRPIDRADPQNTDYLKLTTRREYRKEIDAQRVELWIDRKTHLPVRIVSRDARGDTTTVAFSNVRTNEPFIDAMFDLPTPSGGWQAFVEPWE